MSGSGEGQRGRQIRFIQATKVGAVRILNEINENSSLGL